MAGVGFGGGGGGRERGSKVRARRREKMWTGFGFLGCNRYGFGGGKFGRFKFPD